MEPIFLNFHSSHEDRASPGLSVGRLSERLVTALPQRPQAAQLLLLQGLGWAWMMQGQGSSCEKLTGLKNPTENGDRGGKAALSPGPAGLTSAASVLTQ